MARLRQVLPERAAVLAAVSGYAVRWHREHRLGPRVLSWPLVRARGLADGLDHAALPWWGLAREDLLLGCHPAQGRKGATCAQQGDSEEVQARSAF